MKGVVLGADIYPTADWQTSQELVGQFVQRMKKLGVRSVRWNAANEIGLIRSADPSKLDKVTLYAEGGMTLGILMQNYGFSAVVGIDVTDPSMGRFVMDKLPRDKVLAIELHNEPSLPAWRVDDYYPRCLEAMAQLRYLGIPFCVQYHSMAPSDKRFYEDGSSAQRQVFSQCEYISPHLYGLGSLRGYARFGKPLLITEYHPFRGGRSRERQGNWWDLWRAALTLVLLRRFRNNPKVVAAYHHHASRYYFWDITPETRDYRKYSAWIHRRFA